MAKRVASMKIAKSAQSLKSAMKSISCFWLILFSPHLSWAEDLIRLRDGAATKTEELLAQGLVLIYIERGCSVCHRYVWDLQTCSPSVQNAVRIVSVSTVTQTKELARKIPKSFEIFVIKNPKSASSIQATPTTRSADNRKVGILKCDDLEKWITPKS